MAWPKKIQVGETHNDQCTMAFGRPTKAIGACPRCDELRNGAAPRKGWNATKLEAEARLTKAIREHDCVKSNCGYMCTAFQW